MYRICSRKYDRRWLGNAPDTYKKLWGRCNAGRYVCAFAIHKKSCTIFSAHSDFICIVFFSGRFIDFNRMSDFIYVSIISAV